MAARRLLPALLIGLAAAGCGAKEATAPRAAAADDDPRRHFSAEGPPPDGKKGRYPTARITRRTQLRSQPEGKVVATLRQKTEFGSPTVLSVVGRRPGWLEVLAAELPNDRRGWIPADSARLGGTDFALHVDRSERRVELRRGDRVLRRFTVAVGQPGSETPLGRFAVTDRLNVTGPNSPYGCCAIAFTGHQTKLQPGWPGGDRLAVHGTVQPGSIGRAASLGCLRARKRDMRYLMRTVPLGAPVFIRR